MPKLKGKVKKLEDLLLLLTLTENGKIILKLPHSDKELVLCVNGNRIFILNYDKNPKKTFQTFIENWIYSSLNLIFENYPNESCSGNEFLTKEEVEFFIRNPLLREIKLLPERFRIIEVRSEDIPPFLKLHYTLKRPLTIQTLHDHDFTLTNLVELEKNGTIKIEPDKSINSFPRPVGWALLIILSIITFYYIIPFNYSKLNILKLNEVENRLLKDKILKRKLPTVNGCLHVKFIPKRNKIYVIFNYKDLFKKIITKKNIPDNDYIPLFAVPEK